MTIEQKPPRSYIDMLAGIMPRSWKQNLKLGGAFLPAIAATLVTAFVLSFFCPWYVVAVAAIIMGAGAFATGLFVVAANESNKKENKEQGDGREIARLRGELRSLQNQHRQLQSENRALLHVKGGGTQASVQQDQYTGGNKGEISRAQYDKLLAYATSLVKQKEQLDRNTVINSFLSTYAEDGQEVNTNLNNTMDSLNYSNNGTPYPTKQEELNRDASDGYGSSSSISSYSSIEILNPPKKQKRQETSQPNVPDIICDTHYLPNDIKGPATESLVNERKGGRNK